MWRAEAAWRDELRATSIDDLAALVMAQAPLAARQKGSRWLTAVLAARTPT